MSIEQIYGSTYLTAAIVKSEGLTGRVFTIYDVRTEDFSEKQSKVVLSFKDGALKDLPLNKTNAKILAKSFGDDERQWIGKQVGINLTQRMFQGTLVDAIEVVPK